MEGVDTGQIALPVFQRSHVWSKKPATIAAYFLALFENRPTGAFLIARVSNKLRFDSRTVHGEPPGDEVEEYVLDGQQRLRSLWSALKGRGRHFYVRVEDLTARKLDVQEIVYPSRLHAVTKRHENAAIAYKENLVPIRILGSGTSCNGELGIWDWCEKALTGPPREVKQLELAIQKQLQAPLLGRNLTFCRLARSTEPKAAVDTFVDANRGTIRVTDFDIVVARAQKEIDLRARIRKFHDRSQHIRHYFGKNPEEYIPRIGQWYLMVTCLLTGEPPKKSKYIEAFDALLEAPGSVEEQMGRLESGLDGALAFAAERGAHTERTLPSEPPVYVIAGLHEELQAIRKPPWRIAAENLLSRYWWSAIFTDRHQARANDRLAEDFKQLRGCLRSIAKNGTYDAQEVKALQGELLVEEVRDLSWIGGPNRLARAVATAVSIKADDWGTGVRLDQTKVRELSSQRRLDFHHVFPKDLLKGKVPDEQISHGLNGVWLRKDVNQSLADQDPRDYIERILAESQNLSRAQLRANIESHVVPYEIMRDDEPVASRYPKFLEARAEMVEERMKKLASLGGLNS